MILIDYFTEACCKGTELIEGWYWYEDEEAAIKAAQNGYGWK